MILRMLFMILVAQSDNVRQADIVQSVTAKQRERPFWFVLNSPSLNKIPFAYRVSATRMKFGNGGAAQTTTSTSWCSASVNGGVGCLSDRASVQAAQRPRRHEKDTEAQRFWDEFRKAFTFEVRERLSLRGRPTTRVTFVPKPGYASGRNDDTAMFPYIRGQIWIDETEKEIARFEYEFFKDCSALVFGKIQAGTRYSMDLEKQLDGVWLPREAATALRLTVMSSSFHEESVLQFGDYFE